MISPKKVVVKYVGISAKFPEFIGGGACPIQNLRGGALIISVLATKMLMAQALMVLEGGISVAPMPHLVDNMLQRNISILCNLFSSVNSKT